MLASCKLPGAKFQSPLVVKDLVVHVDGDCKANQLSNRQSSVCFANTHFQLLGVVAGFGLLLQVLHNVLLAWAWWT
jgi:hypothetical protein